MLRHEIWPSWRTDSSTVLASYRRALFTRLLTTRPSCVSLEAPPRTGDLRLYVPRAHPRLMGANPEWVSGMARIAGEIVIGRPVDVVFDYVADQCNEPQYNPRMVRADKITVGTVGRGTRFRSAVASRGRTAEMLIECTGYDRQSCSPPPRWPRPTSATRSGLSPRPRAPG